MSKVEQYVKSCFKKNSVDEELEKEIICSLNERIADYINNGKSEEEAFQNAINDLGDLKKIAEDQNTIRVEKEKIDFKFSVYAYLIVVTEMIIFYFASYIQLGNITIPAIRLDLTIIFVVFFLFYPIFSYITYKNKNSAREISFNYRLQMKNGIIGAFVISIFLITINIFYAREVLWSFFPTVGAFNWPLGISIYNKLYKEE
ncbi:MAG: permease prefix domain 1-containing protein [Eubacteriaceae bacterium]